MNQLNFFQSTTLTSLTGRLLGRMRTAKPRTSSDLVIPQTAAHPSTQHLDIPIAPQSDEGAQRARLEARGQFLARQDRWEELSREIRQYDQDRATTPGGMSCAELLAIGARADVVRPVSIALNDPGLMAKHAPRNGLVDLERMLEDYGDDYGIALVVINAYIDVAWSWRGEGWAQDVAPSHWRKFQQKMQRAEALLDRFCPFELNSPALAATRCALLAAQDRAHSRILDDYQDLIELDPTNPRHMRALGNHLLPRWFGSYQKIEVAARQVSVLTEDIWGAGGYAWVYLDAISVDPEAIHLVDPALFAEGLKDILARNDDQHTANMLAAFCAVTLSQAEFQHSKFRDHAAELAANFDWILRGHLREVHPLIWAEAELGLAPQKQSLPLETLIQRGKTKALSSVAEMFRQALDAGLKVTFRPEGISMTK